ncbi:MAG TPA: hypothetical protein VJI52_02510 [Candidatus Nanoarchaeia archaeon]|nr:hypothetical protein [Candidatus Nanoarchaeia archaeon]
MTTVLGQKLTGYFWKELRQLDISRSTSRILLIALSAILTAAKRLPIESVRYKNDIRHTFTSRAKESI